MIACFWIIARKPTFWIIAPLTTPLMACCSALAAPAVKTTTPKTRPPTNEARRPRAKFIFSLRPFELARPASPDSPVPMLLFGPAVPCSQRGAEYLRNAQIAVDAKERDLL